MVLVVVLVAIVARTCLVISGHKAIPFHATELKHDSVFEGDHDLKEHWAGDRTRTDGRTLVVRDNAATAATSAAAAANGRAVDPLFRSALMTSMSLLTSSGSKRAKWLKRSGADLIISDRVNGREASPITILHHQVHNEKGNSLFIESLYNCRGTYTSMFTNNYPRVKEEHEKAGYGITFFGFITLFLKEI